MLRNAPRKLFIPLNIINKAIKKNNKLIFIYSNLGFRDNVRAFYEYIVSEERFKDYKIVCSLNDYTKYKDDAPENVKFVDNKMGLLYFFRAGFCFYCFGKYPIKPSAEQVVVNLWHGMPLKKIGNMEEGKEEIDYNYFTHIISTSEFYRDIMKKSFSCKDRQILICGQPRTDEMFDKLKDKEKVKSIIGKEFKKLYLWLPTYRNGEEETLPLISDNGMERINSILAEKESLLFIKPHPLSRINKELYSKYSNIIFRTQDDLEDNETTLYSIMKFSDALITDYSSVYFDYMLLDKPIAFTIDDMSKYGQNRGFVFDNPTEYMPGTSISSEERFLQFFTDCLEEKDEYCDKRNEINDLINYYKDGSNCERICRYIGLIKEKSNKLNSGASLQ